MVHGDSIGCPFGDEHGAGVVAIEACPDVAPLTAGCRRVTGTFRGSRGRLLQVRIEGESRSVRITANHPVWSVDCDDWVPAGKLQEGNRLPVGSAGSTPTDRTIPQCHFTAFFRY